MLKKLNLENAGKISLTLLLILSLIMGAGLLLGETFIGKFIMFYGSYLFLFLLATSLSFFILNLTDIDYYLNTKTIIILVISGAAVGTLFLFKPNMIWYPFN